MEPSSDRSASDVWLTIVGIRLAGILLAALIAVAFGHPDEGRHRPPPGVGTWVSPPSAARAGTEEVMDDLRLHD